MSKASDNDKRGDIEKIKMLEFSISTKFLLKSLIASLKGCNIPIYPTLLGPLRIWIYPKIFRSMIV